MPTLLLRHDRTTVRVLADAPVLAWLVEFLGPTFSSGPHDPEAIDPVEIRLTLDAARHDALADELRHVVPHDAPWVALDSRLVLLPRHDLASGPVYVDAKEPALYRLAARGVEILARPGPVAGRLALLRAVREVVAEDLRRAADRLEVHAAAFAVGGRALVLAGPKESGKTTLLVHRLLAGGAHYLANDRVVVRFHPDGVEVAGMPTVVSVRPGTTARFPALGRRVPAVAHPSRLTEAELEDAQEAPPPFPSGERLRLSPAQFGRRMGVEAIASAPLAAILLPELAPDLATFDLRPLHGAAARFALERVPYGLGAGPGVATAFADFSRGLVVEPAVGLDRLATAVPVLVGRLGPGAYDAGDSPGDLVRALDACLR